MKSIYYVDEQGTDKIRADKLLSAIDKWLMDIPKMKICPETVDYDIASIEERITNFQDDVLLLTGRDEEVRQSIEVDAEPYLL